MERAVRNLLTTFILAIVGISLNAQPVPFTEVPSNSTNFVGMGDYVYFTSGDALWRTDGTAAGTFQLKSGFTQTGPYDRDWLREDMPEFARAFKGDFFFVNAHGTELWRSDGTPGGTILLKTSSSNNIRIEESMGDYLFFTAADASTGSELYKTDGTISGTTLVKDINPGSADGYHGGGEVSGNQFYFAANDGTYGRELWKTDGTSAGTVMIKDVNPGSANGSGSPAIAYDGLVFFAGQTAETGVDPWVSDGTPEGTYILSNVTADYGGVESVSYKIVHDGYVYFIVQEDSWAGFDAHLWKTDGTPANTSHIKEVGWAESTAALNRFRVVNDKIVFWNTQDPVYGYLWASDGTAAGTNSIFLTSIIDGELTFSEEVNDFLLFTGHSSGYPHDLYRSDGTAEGTGVFVDRKASFYTNGRDMTGDITKVGNLAFYADHDGPSDYLDEGGNPHNEEDYFHLFQTDAVTAQSMRTMFGVSTRGTFDIADYNGKVVFTTYDNYPDATTAGKQLWIYDPAAPASIGAGKLSVETWNGISGTQVSAIPVDTPPSSTSEINIFETPKNIGDNYGSRVRGYVIPPATGNYTFWIASDDRSELWLSTDDTPANKRRIADVAGWTNSRQWDKYSGQTSAPISLVAGKKYYVEALLKEGTGADHVAVGWQLPDGMLERPIPSNRLMAFNGSVDTAPSVGIRYPEDGQRFAAPAQIEIGADAYDANGSIVKVEFYNGTTKLGEDATKHYSFTWANVPAGNYTISAKAIDNDGETDTHSIDIYVTDPTVCEGAGTIRQEFWTGVSGTRVSDIPVNEDPDFTQDLSLFEGPASPVGDNYGSRIRGYICPPSAGEYVFWISGDDQVELWLSTDDDPAKKRRIAYHTGWTQKRQWDRYATQQSAPIALQAGQRYYVEALMKEGSKADHVSVGWQLPNGTLERPIPGNRLVLFQNEAPVVEFIHPADGRTFNAEHSVQILLDASDSDGRITKIELYTVDLATNEQMMLGTLQAEPYWMNWNPTIGHNYMLIAKATDNSGATATDTVSVFAHPENSGTIQAEVWTGIPGTDVSSIPVNTPPSSVMDLTTFETPRGIGDNYGIRVRGYIFVLNTGNHTFWIASDDRSELWLSTDESPANKTRIAYVDGFTSPRRWDKYPTQKSVPIHLVAGRRYYVEALLKEATGDDHLAVGWQLPSGALQRPIPSQWLIPFESAPATGTIDIETWTGISGTHVSSIPVDSPPDFTSELTIFESPQNVGDNYGSRVKGYIHAPSTGNYTFWIASDDRSELWLSTDEHPANKLRIADVSGWTSPRQWDKYSSQKSVTVSLVGGRKYYIEALLKEGTGGDHLAVGWQLPDGTLERPIAGSRLSPFEASSSTTAARMTTEEDLYSQINVYPNPAKSGDPQLTISGYEGIKKTIETEVQILNMTGEVVFGDRISCGGDCGSYLVNINKQLVPGVYLVRMKTNGVTSAKRLLVK